MCPGEKGRYYNTIRKRTRPHVLEILNNAANVLYLYIGKTSFMFSGEEGDDDTRLMNAGLWFPCGSISDRRKMQQGKCVAAAAQNPKMEIRV